MENEVKEPAPKYHYISPDEYLKMERASERKHEYYNGFVEAMSGASMKHSQICSNLTTEIGPFLKDKGCRILTADMRVSTPERDAYLYPDITIVCDTPELEDQKFDSLLNPTVIFEILSPSTRNKDAGYKFLCYQQINSLQEYIMIDSVKRAINIYRRQPDGCWLPADPSSGSKSLYIKTIGLYIMLDDVYHLTGV